MAALSPDDAVKIDSKLVLEEYLAEQPGEDASALRAFVVHEEPRMSVVPNFVSDEEADHLLQLAEEGWTPSLVGSGTYKTADESQDLKNKPSQNRTSYSCMLCSGQSDIVKNVEFRLAQLAGIDVDYLERLNMVRYAPGQFFNKHHDGRFRPKTVFVYLNDLPEGDGGETFFPELGVKFVPRKGCAVMWSNILSEQKEDLRMVHMGLAPKTAVKYGVNCFFNDKPLKQAEDLSGDDEPGHPSATYDDKFWTIDPDKLVADRSDEPGPQPLVVFSVSDDPKVIVVPNFLTSGEVAGIIAMMEPSSSDHADGGCFSIDGVQDRIARLVELPRSSMTMKLSKCARNDLPSQDLLCLDPKHGVHGQKSVYLFLNDVDEGAQLRFQRLSIQVRPRPGCAVVWTPVSSDGITDERAACKARPPRTGTRFCAACLFSFGPPVVEA